MPRLRRACSASSCSILACSRPAIWPDNSMNRQPRRPPDRSPRMAGSSWSPPAGTGGPASWPEDRVERGQARPGNTPARAPGGDRRGAKPPWHEVIRRLERILAGERVDQLLGGLTNPMHQAVVTLVLREISEYQARFGLAGAVASSGPTAWACAQVPQHWRRPARIRAGTPPNRRRGPRYPEAQWEVRRAQMTPERSCREVCTSSSKRRAPRTSDGKRRTVPP